MIISFCILFVSAENNSDFNRIANDFKIRTLFFSNKSTKCVKESQFEDLGGQLMTSFFGFRDKRIFLYKVQNLTRSTKLSCWDQLLSRIFYPSIYASFSIIHRFPLNFCLQKKRLYIYIYICHWFWQLGKTKQ